MGPGAVSCLAPPPPPSQPPRAARPLGPASLPRPSSRSSFVSDRALALAVQPLVASASVGVRAAALPPELSLAPATRIGHGSSDLHSPGGAAAGSAPGQQHPTAGGGGGTGGDSPLGACAPQPPCSSQQAPDGCCAGSCIRRLAARHPGHPARAAGDGAAGGGGVHARLAGRRAPAARGAAAAADRRHGPGRREQACTNCLCASCPCASWKLQLGQPLTACCPGLAEPRRPPSCLLCSGPAAFGSSSR